MEKDIKGCPAYRDYNVFGLLDKGCCYHFMTYCEDIKSCPIKEIIKKCENNGQVESKDILSILRKGELS